MFFEKVFTFIQIVILFCFNYLFLFKILSVETVILLANIFCRNRYFFEQLFNFCTLNLLSTLLKVLNLNCKFH